MHRMMGGMEDDEWARRQRKWDAWRAEQEAEWRRQKGKKHIDVNGTISRGGIGK
jgi:hypothetical protein